MLPNYSAIVEAILVTFYNLLSEHRYIGGGFCFAAIGVFLSSAVIYFNFLNLLVIHAPDRVGVLETGVHL